MIQQDPLERWLGRSASSNTGRTGMLQAQARDGLVSLAATLEDQSTPPTFDSVGQSLLTLADKGAALRPQDVSLAKSVYWQLEGSDSFHKRPYQEALLHLLGASAELQTLPLWSQIMSAERPHDSEQQQKQNLALSALAFLAIRTEETAVFDELKMHIYHPHPKTRAQAIICLGRAYREADRSLPTGLLTHLQKIARRDIVFEPRFCAREVLRVAGAEVPLDNAGGVYDMKVIWLRNRRIYRTIAVRAEQTLRDLQRFIQHAFGNTNEHLFCFYMNGRKFDDRYRFASAHEDNRPPWAYEAVIGKLGLVPQHRFLYRYNFDQDYLFEVEVMQIRPNVRPGNYPRLIDSHGKPPLLL